MKVLNKYYLIIIFLFLSCKNDKVNMEEKVYELQKRGWRSLSIEHQISDFFYTATQVPIEYYILKNEGVDKLDSLRSILKNERVVEFEFNHVKNVDLLGKEFTHLDYDKAVEYLAFKIKNDFKIVTSGKDTIKCNGVLFERNYKIAPYKRILLYFDNIPPNDYINLIYNDQLFGNGIIKFNFSQRPIKL